MKMIKPIVNVGKIIDNFEAVVVGFRGVISEGDSIRQDAVNALINARKAGKKIVLCSNSPLRSSELADFFISYKVPLKLFEAIITAGEILHYELKAKQGAFANLGNNYFQIGDNQHYGIFDNLDYNRVHSLDEASFVFMGNVESLDDTIEKYIPILQHAVALGLPFVTAGNDTSSFMNEKICLGTGAVAEQYAVLGGKILTVGKPEPIVSAYCLEALPQDIAKEKILFIGDNAATDIKAANLIGAASVLISKGVHINYLGEGYISDVAKTRDLAISLDAYPDCVISNLRW